MFISIYLVKYTGTIIQNNPKRKMHGLMRTVERPRIKFLSVNMFKVTLSEENTGEKGT